MWKPVVKAKFVSIKEMLIFSFLTVSFLIILFPKGQIEHLILDYAGPNLHLANIYLENIIRINQDPNLKLLLAKRYYQLGNTKRAQELLRDIENTQLIDKVLLVKYEKLKRDFFSIDDKAEKENLYKQMQDLLTQSLSKTNDINVMEQIYKEAVSMAFHDLALKSAMAISMYKKDKDIFWLEKVYQHSIQLKDYKTAILYIQKLKQTDQQNYTKWLRQEYAVAILSGDIQTTIETAILLSEMEPDGYQKYKKDLVFILSRQNKYESIISQYIKLYPSKERFLTDILVEIYLLNKNFHKVYEIYLSRYNNTQNIKEKDEYYEKIINLLLANQYFDLLKTFLKNNYKSHIQNPSLAKLSLKASLSTGDVELSYQIAKDIKGSIK